MNQIIKDLEEQIEYRKKEMIKLNETKSSTNNELSSQWQDGRWCGIGSVLCDIINIVKKHKEITNA